MFWETLRDTYDMCFEVSQKSDTPMVPICHSNRVAQVEVTLDQNGNFLGAKSLKGYKKSGEYTLIPTTEDSESRGSDKDDPEKKPDQTAAHPLCEEIKRMQTSGYMTLLKKFRDAAQNAKLNSIYAYVSKGTILKDVAFLIDENAQVIIPGKVARVSKTPKSKKDPEKVMIRWRVEVPGVIQTSTWDDPQLINDWTKYYLASKAAENSGYCIITGQTVPLIRKHPKYLLSNMDKTKLVSSNDLKGFTYRGRFTSADQACSMGFELAQKAYRAFTWLFNNYGYVSNDETPMGYVAWDRSGKKLPKAIGGDIIKNRPQMYVLAKLLTAAGKPIVVPPETYSLEYNRLLQRYIAGYAAKLKDCPTIYVMGTEASTPGCRTITLFREMACSDFLARLESWHRNLSWNFMRYYPTLDGKGKGRVYRAICAPSPYFISKALSGDNATLFKKTLGRLISCMFDGVIIPFDLVQRACDIASKRFTHRENPDPALNLACSLYRGYHNHLHPSERLEMTLDPLNDSRDYLYGRLMACANYLEQQALFKSSISRDTNAMRYTQRCTTSPFDTWMTVRNSLSYCSKKSRGLFIKMDRLMDQITDMFRPEDKTNNKRLTGEFYMGYSSQMESLRSQRSESPAVAEEVLEAEENV